MARGRKRKPTAIRLLEGNLGNVPINDLEPKFSGKPVCPMWLTPKAKTEWKRIVPKLIKLGVATEADQESLIAYCEACARLQEAVKDIQKNGITVTLKNGNPGKNPSVNVFNDAANTIMRISSEFGLTPASRPKIHGKAEELKTDLERFMAGGA